MSTELSTWLHRSGYLSRETRGRGARLSKSTVTLSIPGSTVRMSTNDLAASDTGETCRQYPIAVNTEKTTMTGMLMTAADGLGMKRIALPWACPELFADAALELEYLDSLLLVLSGAARGLFGVNMGAIRADWPAHGKSSAGFSKSNLISLSGDSPTG